jgi:UDP-2-acetamido-2,6-beta-L-arabino-hexul-4-ose reductase
MTNVGITGQAGFIGTHLFNFLGLKKDEVSCISFEDSYFDSEEKLEGFVRKCDAIIHLAALNRHSDPQKIYETNIMLVEKLIAALEKTGAHPHILFASSTQEERDNLFGRSKQEGRIMLAEWSEKNRSPFTGLIIPNVFGPFGSPYYNSVVATFAHRLTHGEAPKIEVDSELKLIHINDLVKIIYDSILTGKRDDEFRVPFTKVIKVMDILGLLENFKISYFDRGIIPDLEDRFERDLFTTFICYMDIGKHFPVKLSQSTDSRGSFTEVIRMNSGGQVSFSTTKPGITRGNHFHTRKVERFVVLKGKALIQLRRIGTGEVLNFELDGSDPAYVDMPVWYTHNITNTGSEDLYTLFWINEFFDAGDPDTFYEIV